MSLFAAASLRLRPLLVSRSGAALPARLRPLQAPASAHLSVAAKNEADVSSSSSSTRAHRAVQIQQPHRQLHAGFPLSAASTDSDDAKREKASFEDVVVDRALLRELSFEDYHKQSTRLRRLSYLFGLPSFAVGLVGSSFVMTSYLISSGALSPEGEPLGLVMGMDPMLFGTLATSGSAVATALLGISLYRVVWRMIYKTQASILDARELDFRIRISKNRYGGEMFSHDYYGDKVKTVRGYRRWLKDQRAAKRKAEKGI